MTALDRTLEPFKNILHQRGHPHMPRRSSGRFARYRRGQWLNNWVEQDHRRLKRRTDPMLGFKRFATARRTIAGVEAMVMLRKGQVTAVPTNDMSLQRDFIANLLILKASTSIANGLLRT